MATIDEQIKSIEEEISKTKYNKATQGHVGKLKAKIAALRQKQEKAQAHSRASGGNQGFEIKKSGDAAGALGGFPSVGKSSLSSQLTEVESEAGNFAFTTLTCIPGIMDHRGAKIQILGKFEHSLSNKRQLSDYKYLDLRYANQIIAKERV